MRYRIVSINFVDGGEKHFPQRLTLRGYKTLADPGYREHANAADHIRKHAGRKVTKRYFW